MRVASASNTRAFFCLRSTLRMGTAMLDDPFVQRGQVAQAQQTASRGLDDPGACVLPVGRGAGLNRSRRGGWALDHERVSAVAAPHFGAEVADIRVLDLVFGLAPSAANIHRN